MSGYLCTKAMTLGGVEFHPGQEIPAEAVLPGRVRALTRQGYIAPADGVATPVAAVAPVEPTTATVVPLTIIRDDESFTIEAKPESVALAVTALQITAEKAGEIIAETTDEDALLIIHALDSRKTVKAAAQERAKKLSEPPEEDGDDEQGGTKTQSGGGEGGE